MRRANSAREGTARSEVVFLAVGRNDTVCASSTSSPQPAVKFKVYLLRRRGRRLAWRDVQNGPRHVGELVTHAVDIGNERYTVATLRPLDPAAAASIPELYEPVLVGFSTL